MSSNKLFWLDEDFTHISENKAERLPNILNILSAISMFNIITTIHHAMESSHMEIDRNFALQKTTEPHKSETTSMRMTFNRI